MLQKKGKFMYNVIIVDDELIIRRFYSDIIDWEKIGFQVVQLCQNGEEAWEYIQNNKVDCILTDIKMPGMSGIDLLSRCQNLHPEIRIVLISGHLEFEFAKEALKHNAADFLTKPVDESELIECMAKIKNELDQKNIDIFMLYQYKREFLNAVLHGHYRNEKNLNQVLINHKIDISQNTKTAIIEIYTEKNTLDNAIASYTTESFSTIIQNLINISEIPVTGYYVSAINDIICYILFPSDNGESFEASADMHCNELTETLSSYSNIVCKKKMITHYNTFEELCKKDRKLNLKSDSGNNIPDLISENKLFSEHKNLLLSYIYSGDFSESKRQLSEFFEELKDNDIEIIKNISAYLLELITKDNFFDNTCMDRTAIQGYLNDIKNEKDYKKIYNSLLDGIKYTMSYIGTDKKNNFATNSIILAKNYIQEHFSENISLEKLSGMYYLSPSYFSKTFKAVFGFTYAEFLKKCRLEKAKKLLLETDYKIYYISKAVGYENTKFFTRIFKTTYGISPKSYREKKLKDEKQ